MLSNLLIVFIIQIVNCLKLKKNIRITLVNISMYYIYKFYLHLSAVKFRCIYIGQRERNAPDKSLECGTNSSANRRIGCS